MNTPLEVESKKDVRVIHPYFFRFYTNFLDKLKENLPGVPRWIMVESTFNDGSPWGWIMPDKGTAEDMSLLPKTAIVPFWFTPKDSDSLSSIQDTGTALTHTQPDRLTPLARRVIGVCPYAMLRQDKDSLENGGGVHLIGEIMQTEKFANAIKPYYSDLVILDPHSHEAMERIEVPHISLTALPLLVEKFKEKYDTPEKRKKVKIVSLDKGGLQRVLKFAELAGLDIKDQVIVLNKERTGHNQIGESNLLWGDPKDSDIVILDDIVDTSKSMQKTCEALKKAGCNDISLMAIHGVLSEKAVYKIRSALDKGLIDHFTITNSLPQAAFYLEGDERIEIMDVAPMMALFSRFVSDFDGVENFMSFLRSPDGERAAKYIEPYMMEPRDKEEVWKEFSKKVGLTPKKPQ